MLVWSDIVRLSLFPLGLSLIFLYAYSSALIRSLEYAREEQHRLTPRSPWYFFDLNFDSVKGGLTVRLFLLVLLAQFATSVIVSFDPWASFSFELSGIIFYMMLGFTGYAAGFVTLIAPRFRHPSLLAISGFIFSFLILAGYLIWLDLWIPSMVLVGLIPGLGMCFHFFAWKSVRSQPNEKWFRLDL